MISNTIDPNTDRTPQWGLQRVFETAGGVIVCADQAAALRALDRATGPGERYVLVTRTPGNPGPWQREATLPALERPCPHCSSPEAQAEITAAYNAWFNREQAGYATFAATHPDAPGGGVDAWLASPQGREIMNERPDAPGTGCVECDYEGTVFTTAGRQLAAFVHSLTATR